MKTRKSQLSLAIGATTLVGALAASPVVSADTNPFAFSDLGNGYMVADHDGEKAGKAKKEGSCGEGKCGDDKAKAKKAKSKKEGSCGEAKCGDDKANKAKKSKKEGSCGEAKCGDKKS